MGFEPVTATAYQIAHLGGLVLGRTIVPAVYHQTRPMAPSDNQGSIRVDYPLSPGAYTAKQLVAAVSPLLETVVCALGQSSPPEDSPLETLLGGLTAILSTSGRVSSLPLSYGASDTSRREIAGQAQIIGTVLVQHARDAFSLEKADANFRIRSPCEGHLWTSAVVSLLMGSRSNRYLMELYNEWLHQMILLRDLLLPFENYDEVPLIITTKAKKGLRGAEEPRKRFLLQCLTGATPYLAIVNLAKTFTAPDLLSGGYGFQYSQGLVLPAFLSGSRSCYLLRYHPARLEDTSSNLLFDYEHQNYYTAPQNNISEPETVVAPGAWPPPSLFALKPQSTKCSLEVNAGSDSTRRILKLQVDIDRGTLVSVDIGQISRGQRYVHHINLSTRPISSHEGPNGTISNGENKTSSKKDQTERSIFESRFTRKSPELSESRPKSASNIHVFLHKASNILSQPGLVTLLSHKPSSDSLTNDANSIHIIPAKNQVIGFALLGKLYPENVVLLNENQAPETANIVGKNFGARFVIMNFENHRPPLSNDDIT
jgi:hypothetical protein